MISIEVSNNHKRVTDKTKRPLLSVNNLKPEVSRKLAIFMGCRKRKMKKLPLCAAVQRCGGFHFLSSIFNRRHAFEMEHLVVAVLG